MSAHIICKNCLSEIEFDKTECPYCNFDFVNKNPINALSLNHLLNNRYTIGDVECEDSEGYLYTAIDNTNKKIVYVKEFAPPSFCQERENNGDIGVCEGKEVLFKTIRMDFKELYTVLKRLNGDDGIVPVLDVFDQNGTVYGVYEKLKGVTLREYINSKQRPLTHEEAIILLEPLSRGIESLHRLGVVHRGISPDTIYITQEGLAVLDGFATLGVRTLGSEIMHALYDGYAAPEQYSVAEFDGNYTDIYALGAVFYFVLSKRNPYSAKKRKQEDTMPTLKQVVPQSPSYVSAVISRAMKISQIERIASPSDLIQNLKRPEKTQFKLSSVQKIIVAAIAITVICFVVLTAILVDSLNNSQQIPITSVPNSSTQEPSVSEPNVLLAPDLVGRLYSEVLNDPNYLGVFRFPVTEQFSSSFKKGEVIEQTPQKDEKVGEDGIIKLIVSSGPKIALMPEIIGFTQAEGEETLKALEINFMIVEIENDGSYIPGTIAKTDVSSGTPLEVESDIVAIYIAREMRTETTG